MADQVDPNLAQRQPFLRPYALVRGTLESAPLDLADRISAVETELRADGWLINRKSVPTDFGGPLGIPVPKVLPIELYLHRLDRKYTPAEAQAALSRVLLGKFLTYSPIAAWAGEIVSEVVVPTASNVLDMTNPGKSWVPWAVGGALLLVALAYLGPMLPRPQYRD